MRRFKYKVELLTTYETRLIIAYENSLEKCRDWKRANQGLGYTIKCYSLPTGVPIKL